MLVYIVLVREMFFKEALNMTENKNKFDKGIEAVSAKARNSKFNKGIAAVDLAAIWNAHKLKNWQNNGQEEK